MWARWRWRVALSLIDLFAEAVLRWSLRCDRPAQDLTSLVMLTMFGGRSGGAVQPHDVEQMRVALHKLTQEPGLREDFLVRALIRELDEVLEDQLENYGRNKARARDRARALEAILRLPRRRERFLEENGISSRQAEKLLAELRHMADTSGGIEDLARRKRALDAWRDLSAPILAPDLLREWREAQLLPRGETTVNDV
jgi:hypothetical protein